MTPQPTTQTARRLKEIYEFSSGHGLLTEGQEIIDFKNELKETATKDLLNMNNCKLCKARIFITSGGCAECSESCPNFLRPLMYADTSLKQIKEIESVEK